MIHVLLQLTFRAIIDRDMHACEGVMVWLKCLAILQHLQRVRYTENPIIDQPSVYLKILERRSLVSAKQPTLISITSGSGMTKESPTINPNAGEQLYTVMPTISPTESAPMNVLK